MFNNVASFKLGTKSDAAMIKERHNVQGEVYFVLTVYGLYIVSTWLLLTNDFLTN